MSRSRCIAFAALLTVGLSGCSPAPVDTPPEVAKIPVTTSSAKARELFWEGRELAERIRPVEARDHFLKAVDKDPQFALAYLYLANTAISAKEFFGSMKKAAFLASEVSEGERHWILGQDAGSRGDPAAQLDHYTALLELYPEDERAHNVLANYYFARQEYEQAIKHFQHATEINSDFSPAYNSLGYASRSAGKIEQAEEAFKKYIELIPDEANPYDSYAELLMKVGRFDESIENYGKALEKDPQFVFSYVGIGNNQMFKGEYDVARSTFAELLSKARNNGERRTAHRWTAVSHAFEGNLDLAVASVEQMSAIAQADEDHAALAGDAGFLGNLFLYSGSGAQALDSYRRGLELMEKADVNDDVKETARRNFLYHEARAAIVSGDLATAAAKSKEYGSAVATRGVSNEMLRAKELLGRLALARGRAQAATEHFQQANQQDPMVLLMSARAYQAAGKLDRARAMAAEAANFNQLAPSFAYVQKPAQTLLLELGADGV